MKPRFIVVLFLVTALIAGACGGSDDTLTVYSGRTENLIAPLIEQFTEETGIDVEVRYEGSADLALLIEEEGDRSPADVFISQSPGALGFLSGNDRLAALDDEVLDLVAPEFRNAQGEWVGLSGRVRVLVYNTDMISEADLPTSAFDLTDEKYRGQVGLAPGNGSFQDFVTAMREVDGDDTALEWLTAMANNDAQSYTNNTAIVQAVGRGEIPLGLVNHYYNYQAIAEDPSLASMNQFFTDGDIGSILLVTALGIVAASDNHEAANEFARFMLSESAQRFFSEETFEYPLAAGVEPASVLPPLSSIAVATYDFDQLGGGLERTKELIDDSGLESS